MDKAKEKRLARQRRHQRVRRRMMGTAERPRLCVFRSLKHIYAQIIDDESGRTLAAASTKTKDVLQPDQSGGNCTGAALVGAAIASRALAAGISKVRFDRNGYRYHGRVKSLAEAAREGGLEF